MSPELVDNLELRAAEQRIQLHRATSELKEKIAVTREQLNPGKNVREHFVGIAAVVSGLAVAAGYAVAGMFVRR